jgi:hypothetical protein
MLNFSTRLSAILAVGTILNAGLALAQSSSSRQLGPCEKIGVACESAGFKEGEAPQGRRIFQDCMTPLLEGQARPASTSRIGE